MIVSLGELRNLISSLVCEETSIKDLDAIVQSNAGELPGSVGNMVGSGGDGIAYEFGPGAIIKVGRMPTENFGSFLPMLSTLESKHVPGIVHVVDHGILSRNNNEVVYWYITKKLRPLSHIEEIAVASVTFGTDPGRLPAAVLARASRFRSNISKMPWQHLDPSPRNVMKDKDGEFTFIDIESFVGGLE